jgi:hypothetical protein
LLVSREEWHFNASRASAKELEDFRIEDMAVTMRTLAPDLWLILDMLLMGDRKHPVETPRTDLDGDHIMSTEEDGDNEGDQGSDERPGASQKNIARREALCTIASAKFPTFLTRCDGLRLD